MRFNAGEAVREVAVIGSSSTLCCYLCSETHEGELCEVHVESASGWARNSGFQMMSEGGSKGSEG
jgi:hypothetical protein